MAGNNSALTWNALVMPVWWVGEDGSEVLDGLERLGLREADLAFRRRALRNLEQHDWKSYLQLLYVLAFGLVPDAWLEELRRVIACPDEERAGELAMQLRDQATAEDDTPDRACVLTWWENVNVIIVSDNSLRSRVISQLLGELSKVAR